MAEEVAAKPAPRVLFFGMHSYFSTCSLLALLESGVDVCAVIVPTEPAPGRPQLVIQRREQPRLARSPLPLAHTGSSSISHIAWQHHIPVWEVQRMEHPDVVATLATYQADLFCVACFSLRIPRAILTLPRSGCLNVHPSLLPVNRGPVPLFWTFREGHTTCGVTIHFMTEKMDSGPVLAQEAFVVPDGIRYAQLEALCAERGGVLLAQIVWDLFHDRAHPVLQDEAKSSYHSFPGDEDFVVYANTWDARHLYNFMRGISGWKQSVTLHTTDAPVFVRDAISYSFESSPAGAFLTGQQAIVVPCRAGWVIVRPEINGPSTS